MFPFNLSSAFSCDLLSFDIFAFLLLQHILSLIHLLNHSLLIIILLLLNSNSVLLAGVHSWSNLLLKNLFTVANFPIGSVSPYLKLVSYTRDQSRGVRCREMLVGLGESNTGIFFEQFEIYLTRAR